MENGSQSRSLFFCCHWNFKLYNSHWNYSFPRCSSWRWTTSTWNFISKYNSSSVEIRSKYTPTHLKLFSENSSNLLETSLSDSRRSPWKVSSSTFCICVCEISRCFRVPNRNSVRRERRIFCKMWKIHIVLNNYFLLWVLHRYLRGSSKFSSTFPNWINSTQTSQISAAYIRHIRWKFTDSAFICRFGGGKHEWEFPSSLLSVRKMSPE